MKTSILKSAQSLAILLLAATLVPAANLREPDGGKGGRVIPVNNLQDSGPGSLRAAVEAGGPRNVVFRVSGCIVLEEPLVVRNPGLTIAGGTAPGDGVCLHGKELVIEAGNVRVEGLKDGAGCDGNLRSLVPPVDRDVDGIPDAWERKRGLDWQNPADGTHDRDGDGRTNLEAYLAGEAPAPAPLAEESSFLDSEAFRGHVEFFNGMEPERVVNLVPNAASWEWMKPRIPLFECPDPEIEEMYYYRWWALRKHLKRVGDYFAYTEFIELETNAWFIPPERTIASALGHHFMETRWLREQAADDSYLDYWMQGNEGGPQGHFHRYSSWLIESLWRRYLVTGDKEFLLERLDLLVADYRRWQEEKQLPGGLYWQHDVWDAMEESISGSRNEKNIRPTINSYMYGNAKALAAMARLAGREELARELDREAEELRGKVLATLWNPESMFFEVVHENGRHAGVREAIGFIPWYFNLPPAGQGYEAAWAQLTDPQGFWAPYGLTTAEIRHPEFRSHGSGTCEWDGAVWPYATSQTLGAMANVLRNYGNTPIGRRDYLDAFLTYTRSQYYEGLPYIGEYLDERTGVWLKGRHPRSYYYHHSTYVDILLTGVLGLQPQADGSLVIDPLLPEGEWPWFCIDRINYRGRDITLFWDADGSRYGHGAGLHLWVDGKPVARSDSLGKLVHEFRN